MRLLGALLIFLSVAAFLYLMVRDLGVRLLLEVVGVVVGVLGAFILGVMLLVG